MADRTTKRLLAAIALGLWTASASARVRNPPRLTNGSRRAHPGHRSRTTRTSALTKNASSQDRTERKKEEREKRYGIPTSRHRRYQQSFRRRMRQRSEQ